MSDSATKTMNLKARDTIIKVDVYEGWNLHATSTWKGTLRAWVRLWQTAAGEERVSQNNLFEVEYCRWNISQKQCLSPTQRMGKCIARVVTESGGKVLHDWHKRAWTCMNTPSSYPTRKHRDSWKVVLKCFIRTGIQPESVDASSSS